MTFYELVRLCAEPFLPLLYQKSRRDLKRLLRKFPPPATVLDVGGRKSPYTIGLPAQITILDVPPQNQTQNELNLGFTAEVLAQLQLRRSNIDRLAIQDMTKCTLPSSTFDCVACVEVIEHVPDDEAFVRQIARVLKPGGVLYLTTPNGDYIRNEVPHYNPDHIRHYTRSELTSLLARHFDSVEVAYGIKTGKHRYQGLKSISVWRPVTLVKVCLHNLVNRVESRGLEQQPKRTAHLFAVAWKKAEQ